jgi:hypothetical protein
MGSLQRGREVRPSTLLGNDLGLVDRVGLALVHDGGRPLANTFLSQSLPDPYTMAITNPSSVGTAQTGVW